MRVFGDSKDGEYIVDYISPWSNGQWVKVTRSQLKHPVSDSLPIKVIMK